jgi:hypothetical protein
VTDPTTNLPRTIVSIIKGDTNSDEEPIETKKTDSFKRTVRSAIQELYRFWND